MTKCDFLQQMYDYEILTRIKLYKTILILINKRYLKLYSFYIHNYVIFHLDFLLKLSSWIISKFSYFIQKIFYNRAFLCTTVNVFNTPLSLLYLFSNFKNLSPSRQRVGILANCGIVILVNTPLV